MFYVGDENVDGKGPLKELTLVDLAPEGANQKEKDTVSSLLGSYEHMMLYVTCKAREQGVVLSARPTLAEVDSVVAAALPHLGFATTTKKGRTRDLGTLSWRTLYLEVPALVKEQSHLNLKQLRATQYS
jgi:hypothetical protein